MNLYARLAKQSPKDAALVAQLGSLQVQVGRFDAGLKNLLKAARLDPRSHEIQHNLSVAYRVAGRLDEAMATINQGLRLAPNDADLIATKADLLRMQGQDDDAWQTIAPAIDGGDRHVALVLSYAWLCGRRGCADRGIELLSPLAADESLRNAHRIEANFRLGELLDRQQRYDEAFEAFSRGNALIRTVHDPDGFTADVTRVIEARSTRAAQAVASPTVRSDVPIFIVGMPRSGTTLVEQILASHPKVAAGGELRIIMNVAGEMSGSLGGIPACPPPGALSRSALDRIARNYLRELRRIGPVAERITDKNPLNFLYLGLIDKVFPAARVIHCLRDPMDTCLSCFFTDFAGSVAVAADLSHLGRFYRDYERLMRHWNRVVGVPIMPLQYEDLVADLDTHARRIIAHAGLEWDDRCLRFYETKRVALTASVEQVRRPIYTSSVGRHTHYESHLEPLRRALGGADQ